MSSREFERIAALIENAAHRGQLEQASRRMFSASKAQRITPEEFQRLAYQKQQRSREFLASETEGYQELSDGA